MSLRQFSLLTSAATFFLILAGALVTSTGSGLSVPDWPLSFGLFFPRMEGGVLFEHGHRMIAGIVALLSAVLAVWVWRKEKRRWLKILSATAFFTVVLQAVLGGLTVLLRLPSAVSIVHAVLAQTFFCVTAAVAFFLHEPQFQRKNSSRVLFLSSAGASVFVFAQLILGAGLRHGSYAYLYAHIAMGTLVALSSAFLTFLSYRHAGTHSGEFKLALSLNLLIALQITLGLYSAFPQYFPFYFHWAARVAAVSAHVGIGALILAGSVVACLNALPASGRESGSHFRQAAVAL